MKKPFNFVVFAIIALALPYTLAQAETSAVAGATTVATAPKPVVTTPATTPTETPVVEEPLAVRKANAEKNLRAIQAQFSLFVTRTQTAIDRLSAKGIDTAKAQTELALTNTSLNLAKTNLDLFTVITIPETPTDPKTEIDTTEIKASLKKIEDNLKDARTHLIQSLTELKASVTINIDAQVQ